MFDPPDDPTVRDLDAPPPVPTAAELDAALGVVLDALAAARRRQPGLLAGPGGDGLAAKLAELGGVLGHVLHGRPLPPVSG